MSMGKDPTCINFLLYHQLYALTFKKDLELDQFINNLQALPNMYSYQIILGPPDINMGSNKQKMGLDTHHRHVLCEMIF